MRLITGYLPATSGRVEVCGFDVSDAPLETKRRVGYLPERNPVHEDMYVREYLRFVAGVHGVADRSERVEEVIAEVGLVPEVHKRIGEAFEGIPTASGVGPGVDSQP